MHISVEPPNERGESSGIRILEKIVGKRAGTTVAAAWRGWGTQGSGMSFASPVVRTSFRRVRARQINTLRACIMVALFSDAGAADVFMSTGPDGSVRYATQALDASYRLVLAEAAPPEQMAPAVPSAQAQFVARVARLRLVIERVSRRHGLSPTLVEAVIAVESNYNPLAVSPKGAQGAMQLMPATSARYGLTGPDAWRDPERNIEAGVRHLKDLLTQHQGNVALALAAYNAGAGAVARHRGRIPPYRETMLYVPAVLALANAPAAAIAP